MNHAIETRGLRMCYRKGLKVLDGLDMKVPVGSVYGFIGRNGAGKTSAIRIIMGLIKQEQGSVRVLGESAFPMSVETRQRVGYLSQDQKMFDWMSIDKLIDFTSTFYPTWDEGYERTLVKKLELPRNVPVGHLSVGERQKAGLLLALAPRPDLLILDEPAASLDTVVRRSFLESILDILTREGITVLISSQILTDIERVADRIGILSRGKMLLSAPLDELKEKIKRLRIRFSGKPPDSIKVPGSIRTVRKGREVLITVSEFSPGLCEELRETLGADVEVQDVDLEDIFIELVG